MTVTQPLQSHFFWSWWKFERGNFAIHLSRSEASRDKLVLSEWTFPSLYLLLHVLYSEWTIFHVGSYLCLFRGPSENNLSARPGSGALAWRGLAHKIKAAEYTERDRSRSRALSSLYSLVFIPSPPGFCLCKLYWGDPINADPDRSQSRHNNLAWQRYRVLFVMIIVPLVTESQQQHCGGFHNFPFKQMLESEEPYHGLIYVGAWPSVCGSGNGWYDSNPVYFIFWCLTLLL